VHKYLCAETIVAKLSKKYNGEILVMPKQFQPKILFLCYIRWEIFSIFQF